ncbi:MAG: hypothetical protein Q7T61_20725 [Caulobacter sp.]|nr:hypothetical protein [Caulobacter sp.]
MGRHDRKTSYLLTLNRHPAFAILLLILLIAAIAALNGFVEINGARWINRPPVVWAGTALLLTLAVAVMGGSVNGRLAGVLIDNRNRVSLSKFQAALWTILVVSALATAAAVNITDWPAALAAWDAHQLTLPAANPPAERPTGPLDINLPTELLFAMGISAVSLVATPSLLSLKANDQPAAGELDKTRQKLNLADGEVQATGKVLSLSSPQLASWSDMFLGEEVTNGASADLGKVQQFAITILLIGVYSAALWKAFATAGAGGGFLEMPPLSQGFVTLLAISHASYLAYKVAPHGRQTPPAGDPPPG